MRNGPASAMTPVVSLHRAFARVVVPLLLLTLSVACGDPTPAGYWEGKGTAKEIPMKDAFRTLTRSASYDFWFTVGEGGDAVGEIEMVSDSDLRVDNLPQVTVPLPFSSMTFAPSVGGRITDLNPRRKFRLVGVLAKQQLTLEIATPEDARPPIEFTIRADPGVSAGFNIPKHGGGSVRGNDKSQVIRSYEAVLALQWRGDSRQASRRALRRQL